MLLSRHSFTGMHSAVSLDDGDWAYISVAVAWTIILLGGMAFLWHHRRLPQLQMRRLPLVFVAMISLHMYWIIVLIAYVLGPAYPCVLEYWVMSLLLPFGIAMFQLANSQFLWIAAQQRRFMSTTSLDDLKMASKNISVLDGHTGSFRQRMVKRFKSVDPITRLIIWVVVAMVVQVMMACLIFLLSRKFHSNFGIFPADLFGTSVELRNMCIRGWEWWLSVVWQFFWAWLYAPYILWKSRNVQDTHGWRVQTILCCIAGLPCSPLWLCGLYAPQFATVNAVIIPPMWFAISIFFIQLFTIFLPCYQIYRTHHLRSETLAAIAAWEARPKGVVSDSIESDATMVNSSLEPPCKGCEATDKEFVYARAVSQGHEDEEDLEQVRKKSEADAKVFRGSDILTMDALEHALSAKADALQVFAALRDFTGENVAFLTHLITWKKVWARREKESETLEFSDAQDQERVEEVRQRDHFNRAIRLYATFISKEHAVFPIMISPAAVQRLDAVFAAPTASVYGTKSKPQVKAASPPADEEHNLTRSVSATQEAERRNSNASVLNLDEVWYWDDIPAGFNGECFDDAEREVKQFVLTETWPKFVSAGHHAETRESQAEMIARRLSTFFTRA